MRVLITGVSGRLGRLVAVDLLGAGHQVIGIDLAPWSDAPASIELIQVDLLKRPAEDVFRTRNPAAVVHLATVTHLTADRESRCRINLLGTKTVFDCCHRHGVKSVVFVGRHTYYGATPDSALYHLEDEPPLGLATYPELGDLVATDLYAVSALWRYPELQSSVLRLCYTLGPAVGGTLATFLHSARVPTVMGFDPLIQFMHETDAVRAITLAVSSSLRGVYNVAGPRPVPLGAVIRDTGRLAVPVPEPLFRLALGKFGLPSLPEGVTSLMKYPIVIDAQNFQRRTGFRHEHDERSTMNDFASAAPIGLG